jgi:hypothetical protein
MKQLSTVVALSAVLLLFSVPAPAQVELKPGVGINFTSVSKDPVGGEVKAQVGWQVGGTVLFGEKLYGEAGLFYSKKSTEFTSSTASSLNFETGITGLRIPAMVGFHLLGGEEEPFALRIFGGGSAFIVTAVDAQGLSKDDFESPTWGVFAGAGVDFLMFYLDAKYEWALSDVSKLSTVDIGKNRSIFLTAGVRLPF